MSETTMSIKPQTQVALQELAEESNESVQEVLAKAVELYRRHRVLEATNAGYAALRADAAQWREVEEERALWEGTLADGLESDHQ